MTVLTDRLQEIAENIEPGETVADIGTDHGLLPVYLVKTGIAPYAIMTDISPGSLAKAQKHCKEEGVEEQAECRLGDGLEVIRPREADVIVIAGMGGLLMHEILTRDSEKTRSFKKFVLQPRSAVGQLRCRLTKEGYAIPQESLVREGKFLCEVLTVLPPDDRKEVTDSLYRTGFENVPEDSILWEVPVWMAERSDPIYRELITRRLKREEYILNEKKKSRFSSAEDTLNNIRYLQSLLKIPMDR